MGDAATSAEEHGLNAHDHGESHVPVHPPAGIGRWLVLLVIALAVTLGVGFWVRYHRNSSDQMSLSSETLNAADSPAPVDVVKVAYAPPTHILTLPGTARAWYESTIYARVSGYVDHWTADIGDRVHKGQVLATIDTPELDDQLRGAQAKVAFDDSEVRVAQANAEFAKTTNSRWKDSPKGVVSEQERDEKEAAYQSSLAKLTAAQSQVQLDAAQVNSLEALTTFKKVTAPYDGVITDRRIDIGDLVTAGSTSSTTPLYSIAQADKIRVFVDVPQTASGDIKVGMPATCTSSQFVGRKFVGKVARTSNAIDSAAKTLKVEVDVDNPDLLLMPGAYVEVEFTTSETKSSLRIPASALTFRSGGPQVAVIGQKGAVKFRSVTISRDLGDFVEIGSGLAEGDLVALNISNQVADGDTVEPTLQHEEGLRPQSSTPTDAVAR
jgi:RND family efflux transporter MFP subunit